MEPNRRIRYMGKISYIFDCLAEIEEVLPEPTGIVLKGVYYDLSSAIEAVMDIIAMLCKDLGIMPRGDYENIQSLQSRGLISKNLAQGLARCNGLRYVIVHQYNGIDDALVIKSNLGVEKDMRAFIRIVEDHLGEH